MLDRLLLLFSITVASVCIALLDSHVGGPVGWTFAGAALLYGTQVVRRLVVHVRFVRSLRRFTWDGELHGVAVRFGWARALRRRCPASADLLRPAAARRADDGTAARGPASRAVPPTSPRPAPTAVRACVAAARQVVARVGGMPRCASGVVRDRCRSPRAPTRRLSWRHGRRAHRNARPRRRTVGASLRVRVRTARARTCRPGRRGLTGARAVGGTGTVRGCSRRSRLLRVRGLTGSQGPASGGTATSLARP